LPSLPTRLSEPPPHCEAEAGLPEKMVQSAVAATVVDRSAAAAHGTALSTTLTATARTAPTIARMGAIVPSGEATLTDEGRQSTGANGRPSIAGSSAGSSPVRATCE